MRSDGWKSRTRTPAPDLTPKPSDAGLSKAALKIDALLGLLAQYPDGITLAELSAFAKLPKSTARRLLATLSALGYVTQHERRGLYRLGVRLIELGAKAKSSIDLRKAAMPIMNRLSEETEETIFLCIRKGDHALCIERIDGKHVQVLALQVGGTLPLYLGGAPRCILASLPDEEIADILSRGIIQYTEHSPRSAEDVWKLVAETRQRGYSVSKEDVTVGVCAMAAPIHDEEGRVVGALSISGIVQRISGDVEQRIIDLVVDGAREISSRLGWREHRQ